MYILWVDAASIIHYHNLDTRRQLLPRNTNCCNTDNQAEVYLPASETAALLSCWYTKNNGIGKYVFFPEGVTFNSSNIPQGTQSTAVYIPIEFPSGIIPPRGNAPWNAHDLLDIICNQTKDRISAKSYDFLKNLQIDNYQKPLVFSFSQPESVTITITGILSFNTNKKKTLICKIQEDFKAFTPIKSSRMDLKYLQERVGQQYAATLSNGRHYEKSREKTKK